MTTLTAATIASMTRTAIWAYITDNSLPVAKKRSTDDARKELTAYIATLEPTEEPVRSETVQEIMAMLTEYSEAPLPEPVQAPVQAPVPTTVQVDEPVTETPETAPVTKHGAVIVAVMVMVAVMVIFTKLVVPTAVAAVKLAVAAYAKATEAYKRFAASEPHHDTVPVDYFGGLDIQ